MSAFRSLAPAVPGFRGLEGESLRNPLTTESHISLEDLPPVPLLGGCTLKILSGVETPTQWEDGETGQSPVSWKKVS